LSGTIPVPLKHSTNNANKKLSKKKFG